MDHKSEINIYTLIRSHASRKKMDIFNKTLVVIFFIDKTAI